MTMPGKRAIAMPGTVPAIADILRPDWPGSWRRLRPSQQLPDDRQDGTRAAGLQVEVVDGGAAADEDGDQNRRALRIGEEDLVIAGRAGRARTTVHRRACGQPVER